MKRAIVTLAAVLGVAGWISGARAATLYGVADNPDAVYTIDTVTGAQTFIGNYTLNAPAQEFLIGGLEFGPDGTLYGVSIGMNPALYRVDTLDGSIAKVGPSFGEFLFEGGLAFDPTNGTAYATNGGSSAAPVLYSVNIVTGVGTPVGVIGNSSHDFNGLAFDASGQLFGLDRITGALWKIDKANPGGVGTEKVGGPFGGGIDLGTVGGMTSDTSTGIAYAYASNSRTLFSINLATGGATVLHSYPANAPRLTGLALLIPEPATAGLILLAGLGCLRRRRRA